MSSDQVFVFCFLSCLTSVWAPDIPSGSEQGGWCPVVRQGAYGMKEQALESGWGSVLVWPVTNIILGKMLIFCENAPCFGFLWGWNDGSKVPCLHGTWY